MRLKCFARQILSRNYIKKDTRKIKIELIQILVKPTLAASVPWGRSRRYMDNAHQLLERDDCQILFYKHLIITIQIHVIYLINSSPS